MVTAWNLRPVRALLGRATLVLAVPGLDGALVRDGAPLRALWRFDALAAGGTAVALSALFSAVALGARPHDLRVVLRRGASSLPRPVLTVALMLGFAFLMNSSGMAAALGGILAATGHYFPLASPVLGWLGVVLTGSNTSSNALFGKLQQVTATQVGLEPLVAVSGNALGGACAQMVTPQGLAVATAGIHALAGREGAVLRRTLPRSLGALAAAALLTALVAGPLDRIVPSSHAASVAPSPSPLEGWLCLWIAALAAAAIGFAARRAGRAPL
jgi:lactate permease